MPTPPVPTAATTRDWLPQVARERERGILDAIPGASTSALDDLIHGLVDRNRAIHELECINLNPATNIMNPRAEALMAAGLGSRPSLGYAGAKYEMGLEAIEEIEVMATELACRVFGARYAELRVPSGSIANLYAFLATCRPGDAIIVPPADVAGHVTHHADGAAGLAGLRIFEAPIDAARYTIDVEGLAALARRVRPSLITMGSSLNLLPHPVREVRAVADEVGAFVLFDAAHACGMFAGHRWPNPLDEGADLMTMSTYKSLGGPPGGMVLTQRADVAERLDAIAHPGLTANFDAGKTAALAIALLDWIDHGDAYASTMVTAAQTLASELATRGVPVFTTEEGPTTSYQFAVDARSWGGGHAAAERLRGADLLASGIGLPIGEGMAGLRLGTPEIVRWGMTATEMPELAGLLADALLTDPRSVLDRTHALRRRFDSIHFVRGGRGIGLTRSGRVDASLITTGAG